MVLTANSLEIGKTKKSVFASNHYNGKLDLTNSPIFVWNSMRELIRINLLPVFALMTALVLGDTGAVLGQSAQFEIQGPVENEGLIPFTPRQAVPGATKAQVADDDATKPNEFLRVTKDAAGKPLAMQTAITRYRPKEGELVVDLVGAIHIGEANYYKTLNEQFEHYDVVLYELVAPQGTRVPAGGKKRSGVPQSPMDLVGYMQQQAQSTLGLESQLAKVDYQKSNFTHADLSPTEMGKKMAQRGDTALTLGLTTFAEILRKQNKVAAEAAKRAELGQQGGADTLTDLNLENFMELLNDPLKLKQMMANQFTESGVMEFGMGAPLNQLIVTDRNEAAMKVLQKEIVNGKKKIAIFYGAAHMPDFEKRLADELGMKRTKQIWVDAWDLTKAGKKPRATGTAKMLFRLLDQMSK